MFLFFFFSSRRRHTRCALVTGVQTCALPISPASSFLGLPHIQMRTAAGMPRAPPRKDRVAAIQSEPIAERPLHRARFAVRARAVIGTARIIEVVEQVHRIQLKRPVLVLEGGHGIDKRIAGRHDPETADWTIGSANVYTP